MGCMLFQVNHLICCYKISPKCGIFLSTVFKDVNTPSPFIEKFPEVEGEGAQAAQADHIYLDAMGFGMGMCCLQVQLQTKTKTKKRKEVALVCKNT